MKPQFAKLVIGVVYFIILGNKLNAQNIFPSSGRAGIYTTSPAASLQVKGGARIGTLANYLNIDSATGNLSFAGTSAYRVAGNRYAFQYAGNTNYGLFFNSTNVQYEFRNGSAVPVFSINANTGNSVFNGTLKVGTYTFPATDGTNGQVLKTNGAGTLTWSTDNTGGPGSGWSLTGNAGTDSSINFLGTTDGHPLVFRVNNKKSGWIDFAGKNNTSFGYQGLLANTTGVNNTANGWAALYSNNGGNENTALGGATLNGNIAGNDNTATGFAALNWNNANNNTATGAYALYANIDGQQNTAIGYSALTSNTKGNFNVAAGVGALWTNTEGNNNAAFGSYSLFSNTVGYSNVAVGTSSLYESTNAHNLVAIGDSALYNQLDIFEGGEFPVYGDNTGVGSKALFGNTRGQRNTAIGSNALYNTQGSGGQASYNTGIGFQSLTSNVFGGGNTALGANADVNDDSRSNATAVGYGALATADNQVMLGNTFVTSVKAAGSIVIISDGRFKKNLKENVPGLAFINQLKPLTYNYDIHGLNKLVTPAAKTNRQVENSSMQKVDEAAIAVKEEILYTGFLAQDVEEAAKKIGYDFSGVYKPQNNKDAYGLSYEAFVVPLVKAVQELSAQNEELKNANEAQQKINSDLQDRLSKLEASLSTTQSVNTTPINLMAASLEQNIPNPFSNTTIINYTLPQKFTSAQIVIADRNGKTLKTINVSGAGKGNLKIDAAMLASGAYSYSLIVNGKLIGTKEMVLAK